MNSPADVPPAGTHAPAWRPRHAGAVVALVCLTLGACSRDLTQSEAKRLLDERSRTLELDIEEAAMTCAEGAGYLRRTQGRECANGKSCYRLAEKGARTFAACGPRFPQGARVKLQLPQVATVTGTSDFPPAPGVKEVQYSYEWNVFALPADLQPCLTPHTTSAPYGPGIGGGKSRTFFRRYDDGWRIEE